MGGVFSKKISRKEFLKYAGIGLLGVVIAKPFLSFFENDDTQELKTGTYGNGPYGGVRK